MVVGRNKRIANNTLMLYFRQILILVVSLYTVRVVLDELGVEDFGIYAAIGGLVALSDFLPGSLAQATQRFFSFSLGEKNYERLKRIFSVNLLLYILVAILVFIVLQTVGLWFVNNQLSIPEGRFESVKQLYFYATWTLVVNVITGPFIAIIMAHEDMRLYAFISIIEALIKLSVVFLLQYIAWDKLELYGFLMLLVSIINALMYLGTCLYKYEECQLRKIYWDSKLFLEIVGFIGWTLFGQITNVARTHAITLLLNQNFSPTVLAARAISTQISTKLNIFSSNFNVSLAPPIIKSYASNQKEEMLDLVIGGSKITFFLLWIFALPMILEMNYILNLWLKVVPQDTSLFAQLSLVEGLILAISLPLTVAARAPGRMRGYELTLGSIQILLFLFAWFFISNGAPAYIVFVVAIIANIVMFFVRLYLLKGLIDFPIFVYLKSSVFPISVIVVFSYFPVYVLAMVLEEGIISFLFMSMISCFWITFLMYYIGISRKWREIVKSKIVEKLKKNDV